MAAVLWKAFRSILGPVGLEGFIVICETRSRRTVALFGWPCVGAQGGSDCVHLAGFSRCLDPCLLEIFLIGMCSPGPRTR